MTELRSFPATPAGFDLHTATDDVLVHHGLPPRPDPVRDPHLHRVWKDVFARTRFVKAEFVDDPIRTSWVRHRPYPRDDMKHLPNWGGWIRPFNQLPDYDTPATAIYAQFVVPFVEQADPAGDQVLNVAFWVGIDGGIEESNDILQAGIAVTVKPNPNGSNLEWYAWTEWFDLEHDQPSKKIANFPVAIGDTISVMVLAMEPDVGRVLMANVTQGHATVVHVDPPPMVTSAGRTVEWVVETPDGSHGLPIFLPFEFTDCFAQTADAVIHPEGGFRTEIKAVGPGDGPTGHGLTTSSLTSPTSVMVEWIKFD